MACAKLGGRSAQIFFFSLFSSYTWYDRKCNLFSKLIWHVTQPAPGDLRTTIKELNRSIKEVKDASFYSSKAKIDKGEDGWLSDSARRAYEAALRDIQDLEKDRDSDEKMLNNGAYYLGHVIAGSGRHRARLNEDMRRVAVDWALIEMSSNRIHLQMHGDEVSGNLVSWMLPVSFLVLFHEL